MQNAEELQRLLNEDDFQNIVDSNRDARIECYRQLGARF